MPRPRHTSLHQRLLVVTGGGVAVVLVTLAVLMFASGRLRHDLSRATDSVLEEQRIADRIVDGVMRQLVSISSASDQGFEPLRPEFEAASAVVYEGLRLYLFRELSVEERLQIETVKEEHQRMEIAALRAMQAGGPRDSGERTSLRGEAMSHALDLIAAMNGFQRLREADLESVAAEQAASFRTLWLLGSLTLATLAVGIGVFLTRFARRRVVQPLTTLSAAVTRLGEGDLSVRVPVEQDREFRELGLAFNLMSERLTAMQGALAVRTSEIEAALEQVRRAQDELVQSEKLGAVGRMSAGLAHELNNPLAAVLGFAELMAAELSGHEAMSREAAIGYVEPIVREATRARQLVRSLLQFSRRASDEVGPVSLNDAMAVVAELRRGTFEQAGLRLEVEPLPAPPVQAEQQRLQGVFFNIVNNALQAMTPRGRGTLRIHGESRGEMALVIFDDEGPGLSQPDRVFEPFFTTKEVGEGTGLGLAISKRFVDAFGGEIRAENRIDGGARFTVALRFADGEFPVAPPTDMALPNRPAESRSVLVVEDEPDLRRLAAKVLRRLGVEVLEAGNVAKARAVLEQRQVNAVVSDVRMPGGSGVDLYRWVEQHRPELVMKFLFVTGDVDAEELGTLAQERPEALLHKPFTISDLLQRVEAMLKS